MEQRERRVFLLLLCLLFAAGCSRAQPPVSDEAAEEKSLPPGLSWNAPPDERALHFDREALSADAALAVKELMAGDFEAVASRFSASLAAGTDAAALSSAWAEAVEILGPYVEHVTLDSVEKGGLCTVVSLERYTGGGLAVKLSYDRRGKLAAFDFPHVKLDWQRDEGGFTSEAVMINMASNAPLGGTLTVPDGVERAPVLILLPDGIASDRDGTSGGRKPLQDIAEALSAQGVAVLRYDTRAYSYPNSAAGEGDAALFDEILADLDAALIHLASDRRLDSRRIYVLGHGLTGAMIPCIAALHPDVRGVISMAASLREPWELRYAQSLAEGAAEEDLSALRTLLLDAPDDTPFLGATAAYWRAASARCGAAWLAEAAQPLLVLQGGADASLSPALDHALWQAALDGRENAVLCAYDDLDHQLISVRERAEEPAHVSPQVLEDIAAFVLPKAE